MAITYDVVTQTGVSKVASQAILRDLESDDLEGSFTIHVTHGHLIRSLIHVLRDILAYGILVLTPTTLSLLRLDKTERVIVSINIDTSRFFQYLFLSRKGVIRIGINFNVLWQCIKVIGKQDSFIMSKSDGDEYVVLDFGNSAKQQYPLQGVCEQHIDLPTYMSGQPNVFITVKELTKAMSYLRTERGRAHIKGYRDRIVVEALNGKKIQRMGVSFDDVWRRIGLTPDQLVAMLVANPELSCSLHLNESKTGIVELEMAQGYPKYGSPDSQPTADVIQSHLVLKSLSKVYTIAPNSSVMATVETNQPIRLVIPIGDYGHLTFYLLSSTWSGGEGVEALSVIGDLSMAPAAFSAEPSAPVENSEEEVRKSRKKKPVVEQQPLELTEQPQVEEIRTTAPPKRRPSKRKVVQPVVVEAE